MSKDIYLPAETGDHTYIHDLRLVVQHNGCEFPIWDLVDVSLGIKHGYKFYALRLHGLKMLPLNEKAKSRFSLYIRGPIIALALVSPRLSVPVSPTTVTYNMVVSSPIDVESCSAYDSE